MWERRELKRRAKEVLRKSYWKAFLVGIILAFVSGGISPPSFNFGSTEMSRTETTNVDWEILAPFLVIGIIIIAAIFLFFLAFRIFLGFPLTVGAMRYYKQAAEGDANLNHLGFAFNKTRYWGTVKALLWSTFLNLLWFLLLYIPGIVKSYAYSLVPFILADNPNIGYKRAVDLSNRMTRGHKFRIFVLDLSFVGWILLGVLALFIGVLFVIPYIYSTKAELYLELRQEALQTGLTTEDELHLNHTPAL
ncbi:DUF975 family protein [Paenibacillus sp. PL2-23]|uniref:DUF975 family protein n=1 Tax=Paenibacillus sp. PL2-23 TaxID=2100729 RepID=UPI0030FAF781